MFGLFRRFRAAWHYAKAAEKKQELETGKVASANTTVAALALVQGLANREAVCSRCFSRFTPKTREFAERFQLRAILIIPDSAPDPMMCDYCFDVTIDSYNRFSSNVGTSNSGPTNLALRRLIAND